MVIKQDKLYRLLRLAGRFHQEAESPNEEDWETVFFSLLYRDTARLGKLTRGLGILEDPEQLNDEELEVLWNEVAQEAEIDDNWNEVARIEREVNKRGLNQKGGA